MLSPYLFYGVFVPRKHLKILKANSEEITLEVSVGKMRRIQIPKAIQNHFMVDEIITVTLKRSE